MRHKFDMTRMEWVVYKIVKYDVDPQKLKSAQNEAAHSRI